ncbi:bacillithiol system redox-active protein YtxJ [Halobacillus naozhouensis]|uniref:Bacillithiol system redox-active protein YtxJ n=1 Tax=Halobacillus naozhouensis TaxID=554880 RepID=A0ABY8ITX1_9BACI|nr:bacillithiol system redox-active protein YtxJ [Halobacillus naozhouensis]WFT73518.1 bacillithiol system redox-active protein YtxJ [Halobacillus naozhouensis]
MTIQHITTEQELSDLIRNNEVFFLLKHSLTCPISASAKEEYELYCKESDLPCFILYVQEDRVLSNKIAEDYHVKHESPQALLFKDKAVCWHNSHHNITVASLTNASDHT